MDTASAEKRAQELLRSLVNKKQWKDYEESGHITVRGSNGTLYRINSFKLSFAVQDERNSWCAYPHNYSELCLTDRVLAHALFLMGDADGFHRVAYVGPFDPESAPDEKQL